MDGPDLLSPAYPFCLSSLPTLHLFSHFLPALSPSLSLLQLCSVGAKKMMLGKRARPQIKRTTSMTGITVDLGQVEAPAPADPQNPIKDVHAANRVEDLVAGSNGYDHRFLAAAVSPRIHRGSSGELMEPAHFLRTCGLCERRLQPGRDIYMYRYSIPTINSHFSLAPISDV